MLIFPSLLDPEDFVELDGDSDVFQPFLEACSQDPHRFGRAPAAVGLGLEEDGRSRREFLPDPPDEVEVQFPAHDELHFPGRY